MPSKPKTFCLNNCRSLAISGRRYCATCAETIDKRREAQRIKYRARTDAKRGNSTARGYDNRWARLSKYVRANEPLCRMCKVQMADLVDHIVALRDGGERLDVDNLQPLCRKCHAIKTAQEIRERKGVTEGGLD